MADSPEPWWVDDPELAEIRRRTLEELELDVEVRGPPGPDVPDPVLAEILNGACRRELAASREDLARVQERYCVAVRNARVAGFSWGEIGAVLGVPRQVLHRRFRNR